jgi:hypothetical protein
MSTQQWMPSSSYGERITQQSMQTESPACLLPGPSPCMPSPPPPGPSSSPPPAPTPIDTPAKREVDGPPAMRS